MLEQTVYFLTLFATALLVTAICFQPSTRLQWAAWGVGNLAAAFAVASTTRPGVGPFVAFLAPLFAVILYQWATLREMQRLSRELQQRLNER